MSHIQKKPFFLALKRLKSIPPTSFFVMFCFVCFFFSAVLVAVVAVGFLRLCDST